MRNDPIAPETIPAIRVTCRGAAVPLRSLELMNVLHPFSLIAPSRSARAALLITLQTMVFNGCSSSGDGSDDGGDLSNPNGGGGSNGGSIPDDGNDGQFIPSGPGNQGGGGGNSGPSTGAETVCDGKDDDGNGIIDDVDVDNDGLCDCIRIGFFGQVASDAGSATGSFESWLVARSGLIPIQHLDATDTLTAAWLSSLQVLIVGGLHERAARAGDGPAFTAEEIAAFDDWIQNQSGGVITLSGYTSNIRDAHPVAELLQNSGLDYDLASVSGAGIISEGAPPVWLTSIATPDHPIVAGVSEVGVFYGYPVTGDGTPILTGEGHVLGMAKEWGAGRVFAFADEWITQDATWSGLANGQQNPCQQPCNEQETICRVAEEQCAQCELQPCSDPAETDPATCTKGCQPSCQSETARCATYTQQCETCTAEVVDRQEATPRLWLNTISWLTPANECKVDIPPRGGVIVR